jgi:RNase H-fold protein (predicted Holliday junction resolvase)
MILGIDVGQKNLGVCVVSTAEPRTITQWAVWESEGSWAKEIYACLGKNATNEFLDGVSHVVIERQPSKNPTMTRIMHYLEF